LAARGRVSTVDERARLSADRTTAACRQQRSACKSRHGRPDAPQGANFARPPSRGGEGGEAGGGGRAVPAAPGARGPFAHHLHRLSRLPAFRPRSQQTVAAATAARPGRARWLNYMIAIDHVACCGHRDFPPPALTSSARLGYVSRPRRAVQTEAPRPQRPSEFPWAFAPQCIAGRTALSVSRHRLDICLPQRGSVHGLCCPE